jgi:hypothetical protein
LPFSYQSLLLQPPLRINLFFPASICLYCLMKGWLQNGDKIEGIWRENLATSGRLVDCVCGGI